MRFVFVVLALIPLGAQQEAPMGILRGDAVNRQGTQLEGDIVFQTSGEPEYRCHYDTYSYLERDGERIGPGAIKPGDHLEILASRKPGSDACYARSIHLLQGIKQQRAVADHIFPRGNIALAGVIVRLSPQMIVLHDRHGTEQIFLLRQDTRYLDSGVLAAFSNLVLNTLVSVRAGKNLDNQLEAFQIIWGKIEGPR